MRRPAEWMRFILIRMEKQRLIMRNVSCGQCLVNCPFGAISDKSQIFQVIRAIQSGEQVYAALAPAFVRTVRCKGNPWKAAGSNERTGIYRCV